MTHSVVSGRFTEGRGIASSISATVISRPIFKRSGPARRPAAQGHVARAILAFAEKKALSSDGVTGRMCFSSRRTERPDKRVTALSSGGGSAKAGIPAAGTPSWITVRISSTVRDRRRRLPARFGPAPTDVHRSRDKHHSARQTEYGHPEPGRRSERAEHELSIACFRMIIFSMRNAASLSKQ